MVRNWAHHLARVLAFVAACAASSAAADDTPEMTKAREAHAGWVATRDAAERADGRPTAGSVNRVVFLEAFSRTDLAAWDATADRDLLRDGLFLSVEQGESAPDPARAVAAGHRFLELFGDDAHAMDVRGLHLPSSQLVAGDASSAIDGVARCGAKVREDLRPEARRLLGDLLAAKGDPVRAREQFEAALTAVGVAPEIPETFSDPKTFAAMRRALQIHGRRGRLEIRMQFIGKPLPRLRTRGGSPGTAAAQTRGTGRAVVVCLFSAAIEEHLAGLLALDALARDLGPGQVSVLAATWFESLAPGGDDDTRKILLPQSRDDLRGEEVTIARSALLRHVRKLHASLDLAFPLGVVQQKVARSWVPEHLGGVFVSTDVDGVVTVAGDAGGLPRKFALLRESLDRPETPPDEGPEPR